MKEPQQTLPLTGFQGLFEPTRISFRSVLRLILQLFASACISAHAAGTPTTQVAAGKLAEAGKIRCGLTTGIRLHVIRDPADGELRGAAYEICRELARRLDVPFEPVIYDTVAKLFEGAAAGDWDLTFFPRDAKREEILDFAPPILEVDVTFIASAGSPIQSISEADRPGVRIALPAGGPEDTFLTRNFTQATLIRGPGSVDFVLDVLKNGKADLYAQGRTLLLEVASRLPGARVLPDRFAAVKPSLAARKGLGANEALAAFVADIKRSGFVAEAIRRGNYQGVGVAP